MAMEDAAVLGSLLSHLSHPAELKPLLEGYQALRLPRASATQRASRLNQRLFHLPDGPGQEGRDASMRAAMAKELERVRIERELRKATMGDGDEGVEHANQWADKRKNDEAFGYDADEEAEKWWVENGAKLCAEAVSTARPVAGN